MPVSRHGRPSGRFTQHRRMDQLRDLLARHPKGLTLYELSQALDVSTRTMRRYMSELGGQFELEQEEDRPGGAHRWRIPASELPRKIELRRTQAYALLAARRIFEMMRGSALYDEIDMAVNKLLNLAHRPGRGPNAGLADAKLEERFLYIPFVPKNYQEKTEELDDLFQAVSDLRPLSLRYRSKGKDTEERITIHPYALVLHRDSVYCVGYHTERSEIRTLLLDRMRDTQASNTERFELPKDFNIDDYFQGEFGVWKAKERHKVVIDFDEHAAEYVRMRNVHPTQKLTQLPGGKLRLSMQVGDLNQVTSWVLEWGKRACVVEPPELVERISTELSQALEHYTPARKR
ncbi:MAG TPA: WYL domain-containing transcriptional regulator [Polyangiaceae bacterium]|nr:WYL domain-containing transcriptional regulator [Polyangiaceae bacterium]